MYCYDSLAQVRNLPKYVYRADTAWQEDQIRWIDMPAVNFDSLTKKNEIDEHNPIDTWETFDVKGYTLGFINGDYENNGFIITTSDISGAYYRSSEYLDAEYRPKLELLISDNLSPVIKVTSPVGEDIVPSEGVANIKWIGTDDSGINGYSIYYSMDYGSTWELIDSVGALTDEYDWQVPKVLYKSRCYIKVIIYDDKWKSSEGQTFFWIDKPTANISTLNNIRLNDFKVFIQNRNIKFDFPLNNRAKSLEVKDIRGRLIRRVLLDNDKNEIQMNNFLPGVYFINILGYNGDQLSRKVVIY